jgi:transposase
MDMWNPYRDAVYKTLPNADVVVDKFHVVRMANKSVEAIRKQIRKELDDKKRKQLKNDRYLMLKRRKDLTPMEQVTLESWMLNFPRLKQAYELKESFFEIWDAIDAKEAHQRYLAWESSIPDGMKTAFYDIIRTYKSWHHEINNYFTHKVTNAYTDSVNNLTRVVNCIGRGYSFKVLRAKMLYAEGAKKTGKVTNYKKMFNQQNFVGRVTMSDWFSVQQEAVDYGVDISILTKLIKEVRL